MGGAKGRLESEKTRVSVSRRHMTRTTDKIDRLPFPDPPSLAVVHRFFWRRGAFREKTSRSDSQNSVQTPAWVPKSAWVRNKKGEILPG